MCSAMKIIKNDKFLVYCSVVTGTNVHCYDVLTDWHKGCYTTIYFWTSPKDELCKYEQSNPLHAVVCQYGTVLHGYGSAT